MEKSPRTIAEENSNNSSASKSKTRCLYCGHEAELIWVHGHGQCSNCGINTEECCRGESCEPFGIKN